MNVQTSIAEKIDQMKPLPASNLEAKVNISLIVYSPELELKLLPKHLKYIFLGNSNTLLVIIFTTLTFLREDKLLAI